LCFDLKNVISDAESNFDINWPTFDINDLVWPSFLYFYVQTFDKPCNFWAWIWFIYQLTYFWYFEYNLTYF
jgi:hypothetical protein